MTVINLQVKDIILRIYLKCKRIPNEKKKPPEINISIIKIVIQKIEEEPQNIE